MYKMPAWRCGPYGLWLQGTKRESILRTVHRRYPQWVNICPTLLKEDM